MRYKILYPLLLALSGILLGCASFKQDKNFVYLRESGGTLKKWMRVTDASRQHWPFAWAAVAVYQDAFDRSRSPLDTSEECPEPHAFLGEHGWERWKSLPLLEPHADTAPLALKAKMDEVHLRAEVWENRDRKTVIVAFAGTAFRNPKDWKANLHWFLSPFGSNDQYTVVSDNFVPAFINAYKDRSSLPGHDWLRDAKIIPVGHSLGGGLAARFAYSLPPNAKLPPITEIYTFDPTPVSGKRGTKYYKENGKELTIYRIYNRGEILASLRSVLHWWNPYDRGEQGQTWLDVRYLDDNWQPVIGAIRSHGIFGLACYMKSMVAPEDL